MEIPEIGKLSESARIVFISGAGVSAESGVKTFRDNGGLWESHNIHDVATPEAWARNPELVQRFYNERRKQLMQVKPNLAHQIIAELEQFFEVKVVTQNVDDLHERAGSTAVLHLHGELRKVRSSLDAELVYELEGWELKMGDLCEKGSQLRPHVVWFGEMVPMIEPAAAVVAEADLLVVVGTSLQVYPAAGLLHAAAAATPVVAIDPAPLDLSGFPGVEHWQLKAGEGMRLLKDKLLKAI